VYYKLFHHSFRSEVNGGPSAAKAGEHAVWNGAADMTSFEPEVVPDQAYSVTKNCSVKPCPFKTG
jgi:hypothetical protein